MKSIVVSAKLGCLLPLLIILNLFFGWMFLKPVLWLGIEIILAVIFLLNLFLLSGAIKRIFSNSPKYRKDTIDVKGEVVDGDENGQG